MSSITTVNNTICSKVEYWEAATCGGSVTLITLNAPIPATISATGGKFITRVKWYYNSIPAGTILNNRLNYAITTCGGLVPSQIVTNTVTATGSAYGPVVATNNS